VPVIDEHYYRPPQWFWDHLARYDGYDRHGAQVYVGEYAAHDDRRRSTLRSALAEAAFLTSLERNGDVVHFASYAPLLSRRGHTQWTPDLIYFNAQEVFPTLNYTVQRLFGENRGDRYCSTKVEQNEKQLAASTVRDGASGDVVVKIVNGTDTARSLRLQFTGLHAGRQNATLIQFGGPDANVANEDGKPPVVALRQSPFTVDAETLYDAPANSLTIIRIK
jgi:alpha-L-arabinofuranosidase